MHAHFGDNEGQITWNMSGLSPRRGWSSTRVNRARTINGKSKPKKERRNGVPGKRTWLLLATPTRKYGYLHTSRAHDFSGCTRKEWIPACSWYDLVASDTGCYTTAPCAYRFVVVVCFLPSGSVFGRARFVATYKRARNQGKTSFFLSRLFFVKPNL